MAGFNIFNLSEEDEESQSVQPGSIGDIFGRTQSNEILQPKGSPTFTDYFKDIVFQAPAKGVGTIAKGLLQIPFAGIDLAFDTDTLSKLDKFFSEGFFKIPETETTVGDITATLVQFGIPISKATKIAPYIPGLRGLSRFDELEKIPSIAGKAGEIAKRAGYFGAIGGLTDLAVSSPGINQTVGEQFGLIDAYAGEDLTGRDKATETLKSKLKFGAEGATISGAIPLLPVAGLGLKYGLKPVGKTIGFIGENAIVAIDRTLINPLQSLIAGTKVANIDVPQIVPKLINKIQSGMDIAGERIVGLLPPKDTPFGKLLSGAYDKYKEWMFVNGGVRSPLFESKDILDNAAQASIKRGEEIFVKLDDLVRNKIIGKSYTPFITEKTSLPVIKYNQSILMDYFNTPGNITAVPKRIVEQDPVTKKFIRKIKKDEKGNVLYGYKYSENDITKKILEGLDERVTGDVVDMAKTAKQYILDIQSELAPYLTKEEIKNGFMEFMGTSFKQGLSSFNNARFNFDPLKQEKAMKFFKNEVLLDSTESRQLIRDNQVINKFSADPVYRAISRGKGDISEVLNITEKNLNKFNTKYELNLDMKTINSYKSQINSSIIDDSLFLKMKSKKINPNKILDVTEDTLESFNKKFKVKLNMGQIDSFKEALTKEADGMALFFKNQAVRSDLSPNQVFKSITEKLGDLGKVKLKDGSMVDIDSLPKLYQKIEQLGGRNKTNLSTVVDWLTSPKGSEAIIGGKKINIPDANYAQGPLSTIIFLNKQNYYRKFFDSVVDMSDRQANVSKKILVNEKEKRIRELDGEQFQKVSPDTIVPGYKKTNIVDPQLMDSTTYYAKPEIANAMKNVDAVFKGLMDNPIYGNFMKLKAGAQIGGTIFSPVAQVRNVTGNAFIALVNGLYGNNISLKDSYKLVIQDIFQGAKLNSKKFQREIDDLINRGILQQNVQTQELKKLFETANRGEISLDSFMNNKIVKKFVDVYQGADSGMKIFADKFYKGAFGTAMKAENPALLQKGTKAYDEFMVEVKDWYSRVAKQDFLDKNYLTNELKTPSEILGDMSAFLVKNTMPTYSMVPKAVRATRELPFGNFASFPSEILRNSANIISIGARELTSANPLIRQMGARRLIGAAAGFGGLGYVVKKGAEAITGVDENKMEAFQRSFAAQYQKNSTLIPVTSVDGNGNFKYYNFSYTNPYDVLVRPANAILEAFSDGRLNKDSADKIVMNALFGNNITGRTGALGEFFAPFMDESIGTERAFDILFRGGVKREGGKVFYPQDDLNTVISKSIEHIAGGIVPGGIRSAQRIWEGATGKFTDAGTIRDMGTEFTAVTTGIRIEDAKPLASMPFIVTSYNKDKQNVDKKFADVAYRPSVSIEQRLDAYKNYLTESYDSQNKMYQTIKDASTIGLDETDVKSIIQSRLNNKKETDSLFNGVFKVPTFNEKAFDSMITRLEKENPILATKVESQIDVVKEIYKDLNSEFQGFDLGTSKEQFEDLLNKTLTPGVREIRRQPQKINILPSSSTPVIPRTPFTYNAPNPSQNIVAGQQQQQTLGSQYNLLSSADKAKLLFGGL